VRTALQRFRAVYGSNALHLLTLIAGFALFGYVLATVKPVTLWNPNTWWHSILVWFAAAIIAHDLVLFPIYALVDRILIIEQGGPAYTAATGQTQEPFLGRWLLLTAAMFATSAVVYVVRLAVARRAMRPPG
jgi:hypothetical protein